MKIHQNTAIGLATVIIVIIVVAVFGSLFGFTTRSGLRVGYRGTETRKTWWGAYALFDGSMRHSLRPSGPADVLNIEAETTSGTLGITVTDSKRAVLYENPNLGTQSLSLKIPGKVSVALKGVQHKGSFRITCGDPISP